MSKTTKLKTCLITSLLLLMTVESTFAGQIIYVDINVTGGAGDGSSWNNAFNYLQDALTSGASADDEIRVAQGTYKPDLGPDITPDDRDVSFRLRNRITIKGGYAGTGEPDPNARDIEIYETILSGDLDSDDLGDLDDTSRNENSYHVIIASGTDATAYLDGFTITAGNANGPYPDYNGGGIYNRQGDPVITNCKFRNNSAKSNGGAMYNTYYSDPNVTNCEFNTNSAGDPSGNYTGQHDLDNQTRVTYLRVDMGTDEVFPIAGDFEPDEDVDFADFAIFTKHWMASVE